MKLSTLSSSKPETVGSKYGTGVSQAIRDVLENIPIGESHSTARVVQDIMARCPDLPKRQVYARLNSATQRDWFRKNFMKDWTDAGDTIYTHNAHTT